MAFEMMIDERRLGLFVAIKRPYTANKNRVSFKTSATKARNKSMKMHPASKNSRQNYLFCIKHSQFCQFFIFSMSSFSNKKTFLRPLVSHLLQGVRMNYVLS